MKDFWINYGIICGGVLISIFLPVVKQYIIKPRGGRFVASKPYLMTGLFSLMVGLLIFAFVEETITGWKEALLAGYVWDSTLQKIRN